MRRAAANPAEPALEELAGLEFVEACVHETMRMKPVAPLIGLQARRDTVVGDVRSPAGGAGFIINVLRRDSLSGQRLPRATAFEPEHWLADGTPGAVVPCGRRRQACVDALRCRASPLPRGATSRCWR